MAAKSFRSQRLISQPCNILPSTWSDLLPMALTSSFQLRFMNRLKHWIFDFLIFETTYSMYELDFRKCSKSGWKDCHQECFMADIFFTSPPCIPDCLWQRTLKLQSLGSSCSWSFHCFAMDSKELSSISNCFGDQLTNKKHQNLHKVIRNDCKGP